MMYNSVPGILQDKVNTMLDSRLGEDAGDVDDELAALEAQIADEQAAAMPTVPTVSALAPCFCVNLLHIPSLRCKGNTCMQKVAEVEPTAEVEPAATSIDETDVATAEAADDLPAAPTHAAEEDREAADEANLVPA